MMVSYRTRFPTGQGFLHDGFLQDNVSYMMGSYRTRFPTGEFPTGQCFLHNGFLQDKLSYMMVSYRTRFPTGQCLLHGLQGSYTGGFPMYMTQGSVTQGSKETPGPPPVGLPWSRPLYPHSQDPPVSPPPLPAVTSSGLRS